MSGPIVLHRQRGNSFNQVITKHVLERGAGHGATGATGATGPQGETGPAGSTDHTELSNIGTNTHVQVDDHLAGANPHSGSAASGANSDITSLTGLTTPLSAAQGGTGSVGTKHSKVVFLGNSFVDNYDVVQKMNVLKSAEAEFIDKGVSANRTDQMAARLESDVFQQFPTLFILASPINDILQDRTIEQIEASFEYIKAQAEAAGIPFITSEVTPFKDFTGAGGNDWTLAKQAILEEWNGTILPSKGVPYALVYDLLEDPANPTKLLPAYDSGDNLHLSSAGFDVWLQPIATLFNAEENHNKGVVFRSTYTGDATDDVAGNDGTVSGASLTTDRNGTADSAYSFRGGANNDKITLPTLGITGATPRTIIIDNKIKDTVVGSAIGWGYDGTALSAFILETNTGGVSGTLKVSLAGAAYTSAAGVLEVDRDHVIAVIYEGGVSSTTSIKVEVDNNPIDLTESGTPGVLVTGDVDYIAGSDGITPNNSNCEQGELNIWDRALSGVERSFEFSRITGWEIQDSFSGAAAEPLEDHIMNLDSSFAGWTDENGDEWEMMGDNSTGNTTSNFSRAYHDTGSRDGTHEVLINWPAAADDNNPAFYVRYQDSDNSVFITVTETEAHLFERVSGSNTERGTAITGLSYTGGDFIRLQAVCSGSTITYKLNDDATKTITYASFGASNVSGNVAIANAKANTRFKDFRSKS